MDYRDLSAEELAIVCFQGGDEPAWVEFVGRFQPMIAGVVFRVGQKWEKTSPQVLDDLVQDTYLKLCGERTELLQTFKSVHKDAIFAYVKVFAANLARDVFKGRRTHKRGGTVAGGSTSGERDCEKIADSKSAESAIERDLLLRQIDAPKSDTRGLQCGADRKIFWLYYRVGLTASAIAALPAVGLTTKGVAIRNGTS